MIASFVRGGEVGGLIMLGPCLFMLDLDLETQSRDKFVVRLMKSRSVRTSVQDTSAKAFVDEYIINHVTRSGTIIISEPSSLME